jgi:hypothetical protein
MQVFDNNLIDINSEIKLIKLVRTLISQFFIIVLLFNSAFAQDKENSIQGNIFDKSTGEPIENVNVYIANTTWGSSTNKKGYCRIHHLPHGIHELVVSCIGYEYIINKINLKDATKLNLNFNLNPIIYETETTRIEGSIHHFLRSFCSKRLSEEGFDIYTMAKAGQRVWGADWYQVLVDYNEYIETEIHSKDTILRFEKYLHVVNNYKYESWIGLNYAYITLDEFGYSYEDRSYRVNGEWAKQGIADLLPKNFKSKAER